MPFHVRIRKLGETLDPSRLVPTQVDLPTGEYQKRCERNAHRKRPEKSNPESDRKRDQVNDHAADALDSDVVPPIFLELNGIYHSPLYRR